MKMYGLVYALILPLATAAQALETVSPLNGKGWEQTQQGLIGRVEPPAEDPVEAKAPPVESAGPFDGVLQPVLGVYPDLLETPPVDAVAPLLLGVWAGELPGRSSPALTDGLSGAMDVGLGDPWSTDPRRTVSVGFTNAGSSVDLPVFAEIDLTGTALPAEREASVMEIVVSPALGLLLLLFSAAAIVRRVHRRKTLSRTEQLLQV